MNSANPSSPATGPMSPASVTCETLGDITYPTAIPSSAGSRVKTSPSPARVPELTESDPAYGKSSRVLLGSFDRATSSWRTSAPLLFEDFAESSETLPPWGWMQNGSLYELPTPARPIAENGSSLLPTPTASDARAHHSDAIRFDSLSAWLRSRFGFPAHLNPRFVEWMMSFPIGWTA